MPEAAAGMNTDRQIMPLCSSIDGLQMPSSERRLVHCQHQHLHETPILGAAFNLVHGILDILEQDHDRGAKPRIAIQPFLRDPVVERAREGFGHILVERKLHTIKAIADRKTRLPTIQNLFSQSRWIGGRETIAIAPIRPRADRSVRRVTSQTQARKCRAP